MKLNGPGKYDGQAAQAMKDTHAQSVVLLVINGWLGSGVAVKARDEHMRALPGVLRTLADELESDLRAEPAP